MEYKTTQQLRREFLDFFKEKDHYIESSYPLIPEDDPSILLIGAGMAPLKKYFMGVQKPPSKRMATCQKCIRIGDLDNVGETSRHLTFFEMLGNFSFGDYFKKETLEWGMEFLTKNLGIPLEKLWVSVYEEDEESYLLWRDVLKFPEERIVKLGKEDNFWEIGLGPCGPCSEIYYDRGEVYGCGDPNHKPGCDCDQYVEIWNHVFTQFNKNEDGSYTPLKNKNIDTGMGLERLAVVIQDKENVFEVDHMMEILHTIEKISGKKYGKDANTNKAMRILCDHLRSITFMISDGVLISNEGRGYILKKLIRRSALQVKKLGMDDKALQEIALSVIKVYKEQYPALWTDKQLILDTIEDENKKFSVTLDRGIQYLENLLKEEGNEVSGKEAFKLYDTYGFPLELTVDLAGEKGKSVSMEDFEKEMEHQKELARAAGATSAAAWNPHLLQKLSLLPSTDFTGYHTLDEKSTVIELIQGEDFMTSVESGEALVILDKTPFYATAGGQLHDIGFIGTSPVLDVTKIGDIVIHKVEVKDPLSLGDTIEASVEGCRRKDMERNHSATHLLHEALTQILPGDTHQAGSEVSPTRLRFDFTSARGLSQEELEILEDRVNEAIMENYPVTAQVQSMDEALEMGAKALFTEKYADNVRTVKMGDFCVELCGGTHVRSTGEIGSFKILSERAIASGVRRIEAITGRESLQYFRELEKEQKEAVSLLSSSREDWLQGLKQLIQQEKDLHKENDELKTLINYGKIEVVRSAVKDVNGVHVYYYVFEDKTMDDLKTISDEILARDEEGFTLFISVVEDKLILLSGSKPNAIDKGFKSGVMLKNIASRLGGGGGGRDTFASAGAKHVEKLDGISSQIEDILREIATQ